MSSGFGTQHNDSRDEPTYESLEMRTMCPTNSTETAPPETPQMLHGDLDQMGDHYYTQYRRSLVSRSPSYRKSLDRISLLSTNSSRTSPQDTVKKSSQQDSQSSDRKDSLYSRNLRQSIELPRLPSSQSINTLSNDQDELLTQSNLRDELLNCDQKELFQFLSDDFDTSNNYFSETVGFGSALIDSETDSLVFDSNKDDQMFSPPRKTSSSSMKSNFSYISNSIFAVLEQKRGGSISESIDRMLTRSDSSHPDGDDQEPLVKDSEFENIIASFERELLEIKKSTTSLHRRRSTSSSRNSDTAIDTIPEMTSASSPPQPYQQSYQEVLPRRTTNDQTKANRESVKIKRRSLEKQNKVDDGFSVSNEIRKICDHIQAPFNDVNNIAKSTSPRLRRKNDFQSSFDRIKRTSLIERVDESIEDERPAPARIVSEKLPRKHLTADLKIDSISLKSTNSYENLLCHREQIKQENAKNAQSVEASKVTTKDDSEKQTLKSPQTGTGTLGKGEKLGNF